MLTKKSLEYMNGILYQVRENIRERKFDRRSSPNELAIFIARSLEAFEHAILNEDFRESVLENYGHETFKEALKLYESFFSTSRKSEDIVHLFKKTYRDYGDQLASFVVEYEDWVRPQVLIYFNPSSIYKAPDSRLAQALEISKSRLPPVEEIVTRNVSRVENVPPIKKT